MSATGLVAWLFPGQGSQFVGMGKAEHDRYAEARAIFAEADRVLGFALSDLCFEGPEDELQLTLNAQPAILTVSVAHLAVLEAGGVLPVAAYTAGHSLGEYTALVAAGVLTFADAVALVRERGRLMHEAGRGKTGMAAVLGLEDPVLEEICRETGAEVANYNCPGQIAIAGPLDRLEAAMALARERGAKRVVPLPVSAAFHSSVMRPVAEALGRAMARIAFAEARIPVVGNVEATAMTAAWAWPSELMRQTCAPVQWVRSVQHLSQQGVETFLEIGPGSVLTGLTRRIARGATCLTSESVLTGLQPSAAGVH